MTSTARNRPRSGICRVWCSTHTDLQCEVHSNCGCVTVCRGWGVWGCVCVCVWGGGGGHLKWPEPQRGQPVAELVLPVCKVARDFQLLVPCSLVEHLEEACGRFVCRAVFSVAIQQKCGRPRQWSTVRLHATATEVGRTGRRNRGVTLKVMRPAHAHISLS